MAGFASSDDGLRHMVVVVRGGATICSGDAVENRIASSTGGGSRALKGGRVAQVGVAGRHGVGVARWLRRAMMVSGAREDKGRKGGQGFRDPERGRVVINGRGKV